MSAARAGSHRDNAGGSSRRRQRPAVADDSSDDDEAADGSRLTDGPRPKRLRPSTGADDDGNDDNDNTNDTFYSARSGRPSGVDAARRPSKPTFQPGAIVRVLVENFVTYERAEFNPGPSLNMVIGPNGTGKSSLVCAICLGLGFHTNVLGRAAAFGDFVKYGRTHAVVEIELQGKTPGSDGGGDGDDGGGDGNHVVRLRISREDNSRKFWLNGQEAPLRRVQALMGELRIQVDNLCQFLPQDRVAEFAGLNSVDLLAKTLEAAAPVAMKETQAALRDVYRQQREAEHQLRVDAERLRVLENRHAAQQADVERFREREDILKAIDDLEACRPLVRFYEAKRMYGALKKKQRAATRELAALQARLAPTLQGVNAKQAYAEALERGVLNRKDVLTKTEHAAARSLAGLERIDDQIKEAGDQRRVLTGAIEKKKREIATTRQKITTLEAALKNKPSEFVAANWNMKIRDKEHQRREIEAERREAVDDMDRIKLQAGRIHAERQQAEKDIAGLESRRGQQLSLLRRVAPDVARGWEWLEANKRHFSKEIFGPPMVTCSIKDQRYSNLVQSLMQNDDYLCFTTQCVEDHRKLSHQFYEEMGLSVTIRTCPMALESFQRPVGPEALAAMGFEGLAVDYIEGPAPVLAMLCAERRLHCSPVSINKPRQDQYDMVVANESISTWAAKDQSYRVNRRREYGAHAVSTAVRDILPGRYWRHEAQADMSEKTELQRTVGELNERLRDLREQLAAARERAEAPVRRAEEVGAEIEQLRHEKNQLQSEYAKWQALPDKIEAENNTLHRVREEHASLMQQRLTVLEQLDELVLHKARAAARHVEHTAAIGRAYFTLVDVQLRAAEAASDFESLRTKNASLAALLEEKQAAFADIATDMKDLKREALAAEAAVRPLEQTDGVRAAALRERALTMTRASLANEVSAEQAKLELTRVVDAGVLDEYRQREREIGALQTQLAAHGAGHADLEAQIAALRGQWEPQLDALIGRINDAFSYNFEQINCAGEVSVHKDEDFDKWAIEIRVKFREHEQLQKLDQHRQSGGERAVSTIFYLMSLQGTAQAPFRVVDEINQGMDPRNERMMHERMVEIACHEHTSQYFLITPKLLPGLRYDENMTVLCIASGQFVPGNEARLDFGKCMQIQRRLLAAA